MENSIRARPFIGGRIATGTSYVQPVDLYNPLARPIQILEVFSSSPQLQLELSEDPESYPGGAKATATNFSWSVLPYQSKRVMFVTVSSDEPGLVEGYVNIRTNVYFANVDVPVKVDVSSELGLYFGPRDTVDFGAVSVTDPPRSQLVQVLSNTDKLLKVIGASVAKCKVGTPPPHTHTHTHTPPHRPRLGALQCQYRCTFKRESCE